MQARERRDGNNKDYSETEVISTTADYRAVAPDAKAWVITIINDNDSDNIIILMAIIMIIH